MKTITKTKEQAIKYCKSILESKGAVNINPTHHNYACRSVQCQCGETGSVDYSGINNHHLISVICGYCNECGSNIN